MKSIIFQRNKLILKLIKNLQNIKELILPNIKNIYEHNFYILPIQIKDENFKRNKIVKDLKKQGLKGLIEGYQNIHLLEIFKKRVAYGTKGFPINKSWQKYKKGLCPVAEKLHEKNFIGLELCLFELREKDIIFITKCFRNVWKKYKK